MTRLPGAMCVQAGDVSERRRIERRRRIAEVRMVEQTECFDPELEFQAFLEREILEYGEVHVRQTRSVEQVAAGVAIGVTGLG